ncbi:MAG: hypothetical protein ACUVTR_07550 [Dehalococcoidia bacterium]
MPCRIGITTKPEAAQVYWQDRAIGFANWQILEVFRSKAAAKEYETAYALRHECEAQLDNRDAPNAVRDSGTIYDWWYVYHFDYETVKE